MGSRRWVIAVSSKTRAGLDPTGYPPWHSGSGAPILSTRLGVDATKPLDLGFPEVAEPPRELWSGLDLNDYLK